MKNSIDADNLGQCALPIDRHDKIQLGHGSGGEMMFRLIHETIARSLSDPTLDQMEDAAVIQIGDTRLSFSTDSYVVDPLFFPGGNIGELAVNGTVNDLCMRGARPLFLSLGLILEEGLDLMDLQQIIGSIRMAADRAGVFIITGDTKVVHRGQCDKIYINTSGIGVLEQDWDLGWHRIQPGDHLLLSGTVGDHGVSILSKREGLAFESAIESDTAALNELVSEMLAEAGTQLHALRDPTRGGLSAALNEWARAAQVGVQIHSGHIPVQPAVQAACELLGLDPLFIANEGKLVAAVHPDAAERLLKAMRNHPLGAKAECIGEVVAEKPGLVRIKTDIGAWRVVSMPVGEQLPRIC